MKQGGYLVLLILVGNTSLTSRKVKKYVNKEFIPACELKLWPVELLDELLVSLLSSIRNLLFSVLEGRTDDSFPFNTA